MNRYIPKRCGPRLHFIDKMRCYYHNEQSRNGNNRHEIASTVKGAAPPNKKYNRTQKEKNAGIKSYTPEKTNGDKKSKQEMD
jgi:hypothetical protein